jgi:hypothetical protein
LKPPTNPGAQKKHRHSVAPLSPAESHLVKLSNSMFMFDVHIRAGDGAIKGKGPPENIPKVKIDVLAMIPGAFDMLK